MLVVLNLPLIGIWVRLLTVRYRLLYPAILVLCCIGVYSVSNSAFLVYFTAFSGVLGYVFTKLDREPAPMLLGFVLGPLSLGVHGRTEQLPPEEVLEITTMCGHAMVSAALVRKMVDDLERGRRTYADAAGELSRLCVCGIFNPERAEHVLRKLTGRPAA